MTLIEARDRDGDLLLYQWDGEVLYRVIPVGDGKTRDCPIGNCISMDSLREFALIRGVEIVAVVED